MSIKLQGCKIKTCQAEKENDSMKINYNVSAAIANKHLLGIEDNLSTTMERLSSGLKINHSKDNPAGMQFPAR